MIQAASHNRRGRLTLLAVLLALCCRWACAQGQYDSARQSMRPAELTTSVPANRLTPPATGHTSAPLSPKARLQALARAADAPVPAATNTTPPPPTTAAAEPQPPQSPTPLTAAAGEKPAPPEDPEEVRLSGDRLRDTKTGTEVEGEVEIRYQDLTLRGERASLDADRVWATFRGPVTLEGKLYQALGRDLRVNLDTEAWEIGDAAASVQPEFFGQYVKEALYLRARQVNGAPQEVIGRHGHGTSCDRWPDPHWELRSDRITYRPGEIVTFEKPTLYLFGHRLFRYPWDLRLSLRRKENRFLPEVGQNEVEGFYAKFAYGYALNEANDGFLRLNLTEKRGTGFGVDHTLDTQSQQGQLSLFFEPEMNSFTGRLSHHAQVSRPFATNVDLSFQQDSGYGIASDSFSGDLTLRYDTGRSQSLLGFQQSILSSDYSDSQRFSTNLTHQQRLGTDGSWGLRTTYSASRYTDQATDEELQTELTWRQQFRAFGVNFLAQKRYDLDSSRYTGDDNYYALNRTPDIAINTDSLHLGDFRLLGSGFESTLYLGRFEQFPEDLVLTRGGIDLRLPGHVQQLGGRASLQTSGRFQQMFYSDNSAQWLGQIETQYYYKLTRSWDSRLSLSYLKPNGYSPLRTEYYSPSSILYWQAVRLVPEKMRLDFTFGRDFHNNYFQDAIVRAEIMLTPRDRLELQGGYSPELSQFRPLNLRWIYATERAWWSAITVNYDLENTDLTDVSFDVDWYPLDKWRVQFLGGYSSYGGLDQADIRIMRDLHCMLASLTYIHSTQEIRLGFGIKAFPTDTRTFGVGSSGQFFESNFGDQY